MAVVASLSNVLNYWMFLIFPIFAMLLLSCTESITCLYTLKYNMRVI
jgi:hypothetical protein